MAAPEPERRAPTLAEAVGGPLGILESSLPAVAFVVAYIISGSDTNASAIVAVALALVLTVLRLARRESPRHALSGLVGVAFAAFIATRSGRAENFFLPGLLANAAYAAAFLISLAARWPLVGVIVGQLDGEGNQWREDPARVRASCAPPGCGRGCSWCGLRCSCRCTWRARWWRSGSPGRPWACRCSGSACGSRGGSCAATRRLSRERSRLPGMEIAIISMVITIFVFVAGAYLAGRG